MMKNKPLLVIYFDAVDAGFSMNNKSRNTMTNQSSTRKARTTGLVILAVALLGFSLLLKFIIGLKPALF